MSVLGAFLLGLGAGMLVVNMTMLALRHGAPLSISSAAVAFGVVIVVTFLVAVIAS